MTDVVVFHFKVGFYKHRLPSANAAGFDMLIVRVTSIFDVIISVCGEHAEADVRTSHTIPSFIQRKPDGASALNDDSFPVPVSCGFKVAPPL